MPSPLRMGDALSCGDHPSSGSPDVIVNGIPAARTGDETTGHDCFPRSVMVGGSATVFINGQPACLSDGLSRNSGHSCGGDDHVGTSTAGSADVFIGG